MGLDEANGILEMLEGFDEFVPEVVVFLGHSCQRLVVLVEGSLVDSLLLLESFIVLLIEPAFLLSEGTIRFHLLYFPP